MRALLAATFPLSIRRRSRQRSTAIGNNVPKKYQHERLCHVRDRAHKPDRAIVMTLVALGDIGRIDAQGLATNAGIEQLTGKNF